MGECHRIGPGSRTDVAFPAFHAAVTPVDRQGRALPARGAVFAVDFDRLRESRIGSRRRDQRTWCTVGKLQPGRHEIFSLHRVQHRGRRHGLNEHDRPQEIKNRQGPAIEALFDALLYSGLAMTMVGTSAPASGGEHLLSHTLDMMSAVDGIGHDLHGRQVGLGAIFSSALYDHILKIESPEAHRIRSNIDESFWAGLARNVREQYRQKEPALRIISDKILDGETWSTFRNVAEKQVRHPTEIKQSTI